MLSFVMFPFKVLSLLERGVGDYLSVDLWLERCMVGMQGMSTPAGAAESRYYYNFTSVEIVSFSFLQANI